MPTFELIDVSETPYLYVERRSSMAPADVGNAMASAFGEVWGFMQKHGVPPAGGALSVYVDYSEAVLAFRAGFIIGPDDMAAAEGAVKADVTPGARVLHFTLVGSYEGLRPAYEEMMAHLEAEGLHYTSPTWEFYMNDPNEVPEDQLVTECFQALAG